MPLMKHIFADILSRSNMTTSSTSQKLDNALFEQLQLKIDEDSDLRQKLHDIINAWEKQR